MMVWWAQPSGEPPNFHNFHTVHTIGAIDVHNPACAAEHAVHMTVCKFCSAYGVAAFTAVHWMSGASSGAVKGGWSELTDLLHPCYCGPLVLPDSWNKPVKHYSTATRHGHDHTYTGVVRAGCSCWASCAVRAWWPFVWRGWRRR